MKKAVILKVAHSLKWVTTPVLYRSCSFFKRNFLGILTIFSTLLFVIPSEYFLLNLIQSFTFQAMMCYAFLGILCLFIKYHAGVYASFFSSMVVGTFLLPYFGTGEVSLTEKVDLKVGHFNVFKKNDNYGKTIDRALGSGADFLSFQEVTPSWAKALRQGLTQEYPHYKIVFHENPSYGMAVFSKYPLENLQIPYWTGVPNITGDIVLPDSSVHFLAAHTRSPMRYWRYRNRNEHLRHITRYVSDQEGPTIVMGDFNIVPWAPQIRDLREHTGLRDSRKALVPTFPADLSLAQIPIDYIFHSEDIACTGFAAVEGTSSDHLGVMGTYRILR